MMSMGFKLVICPPNFQEHWSDLLRKELPGIDVHLCTTVGEAMEVIGDADAASSGIVPKLLERAEKLCRKKMHFWPRFVRLITTLPRLGRGSSTARFAQRLLMVRSRPWPGQRTIIDQFACRRTWRPSFPRLGPWQRWRKRGQNSLRPRDREAYGMGSEPSQRPQLRRLRRRTPPLRYGLALEAISKIPNKVYAPDQRESVGWNGGAGIERCPMETNTALVASA